MKIVVVGGFGDLGARVVTRVREAGHLALPASRRSGVDLATGAGLDAALEGADGVVHCASRPARSHAVDVDGTRRLTEALARLPSRPHLVYISIVGCDRIPYGYYGAKAAAERVIQDAGVPATVLRATQFHALAAFMARLGSVGRLAFRIGDMAVQPVDIDWVAIRLTQVAAGPVPAGFQRAADLAGPEVLGIDEVARLVAEHDSRAAPWVLRVPPVGGTMRAFSRGSNLPGPMVETGGRRLADWLAAQPAPLPRRMREPRR